MFVNIHITVRIINIVSMYLAINLFHDNLYVNYRNLFCQVLNWGAV